MCVCVYHVILQLYGKLVVLAGYSTGAEVAKGARGGVSAGAVSLAVPTGSVSCLLQQTDVCNALKSHLFGRNGLWSDAAGACGVSASV